MRISIAADHAGYDLTEKVQADLVQKEEAT